VERKAISIMKACALVGVSRRTIYNWITAGKVEYVRTAGGSIRIFVDSLWRDPHAGQPDCGNCNATSGRVRYPQRFRPFPRWRNRHALCKPMLQPGRVA